MRKESFLVGLVAMAFTSGTPVLAQEETELFINGKVTDQHNKPVPGAKILIRDCATGRELVAQANGKGNFKVKHAPTRTESLSVFPPQETGLAEAQLDHIAGDKTKHVIVQLKKGFRVSGRVIDANGRPLKDVAVRVAAKGASHPIEHAHGGGHANTARNGVFKMNLIPGHKIFQFSNSKYADLAPSIEQDLNIASDMILPDIVLPGRGAR